MSEDFPKGGTLEERVAWIAARPEMKAIFDTILDRAEATMRERETPRPHFELVDIEAPAGGSDRVSFILRATLPWYRLKIVL